MYRTNVIADSVSPRGIRLTTLEVEFPRFILAEFNTHRMFSRSSASSRAIPIQKQLEKLDKDPFIPEYWGAAQKGMAADHEVRDDIKKACRDAWLSSLRNNAQVVQAMSNAGLHKQIPNRLLEPFMWHTAIVTATEWDNFFALRISPHAQPEMRRTAEVMKAAMDNSTPELVEAGCYHLPFIDLVDRELEQNSKKLRQISVGRCARVSYLTHDGQRDHSEDIRLHNQLLQSGHMSPFEHVAEAQGDFWDAQWSGNFFGWNQYRKTIPYENNFGDRDA